MSTRILLAGIHGVGKTYFCDKFLTNDCFPVFTASEIIEKQKNISFGKDKKIEHIDDNQIALIKGLDMLDKEHPNYIINGHFTLLNKEGNIVEIDHSAIENMNLDYILLMYDNAKSIADRLNNRDSSLFDEEFIVKFQDKEIKCAEIISRNLNIPLLKFNPNIIKGEKIIKIIEEFVKEKDGGLNE